MSTYSRIILPPCYPSSYITCEGLIISQCTTTPVLCVTSVLSPHVHIYYNGLNTPAALELVSRCHLGPRTRKIEIWLPELVKLCHLGPYLFKGHEYMQKSS